MHTKVALISVAKPCQLTTPAGSCSHENLQPKGKAVNVSGGIGAAPGAGDGREADKDGSFLASGA